MSEDILSRVVFYEHGKDGRINEDYLFDNECHLYENWIRKAIVKERNKKLKDIVAKGIFNKHTLEGILVRLKAKDEDFVVALSEGGQKPYNPNEICQGGVLTYPPFEDVLSNLGYLGDDLDFESDCDGDYIFNSDACKRLTVGDLDYILQSDYIDVISIMLERVGSFK